MNLLKRMLTVVLAADLCLSGAAALPAKADNDTLTYGVWQYTIETDSILGEDVVTLTNCDRSVTEVTIPDEIDGVPVVHLYNAIFADCNDLTTITVGANVLNLDGFIFGGCDKLMNILTVVGSRYTSQDGVLFEDDALVCCPVARMGTYTVPEGTRVVRSAAFCTCAGLTEIEIPASVEEIQTNSFFECPNLKNVSIDEDNPNYIFRDGVVFNKEGTKLITCISSKAGDYIIPEGVKGMQSQAFYGCSSLTGVTVPEGMSSINMFAFAACFALKSVTLPVGLEEVQMSAFYACNALTDVYYAGTETQWQEVTIATGNENLTNAAIHFNAVAPVEPEICLGNVNGDDVINASDAAVVLIAAAEIGAGGEADLTDAQRKAADVNRDGKINASDAAVILMYAAAVGAGEQNVKIEDFVMGQ